MLGRHVSPNDELMNEMVVHAEKIIRVIFKGLLLRALPFLYYIPWFDIVGQMTNDYNAGLKIIDKLTKEKINENQKLSWFEQIVKEAEIRSFRK